ncbi:MAG: bifunctional nuclease domain-containing protein [Candidatus Latescibacterota bacterium]|nr:bifunctional nuclease domain-containing protein [Candidatus Latescibacterota bacterium]
MESASIVEMLVVTVRPYLREDRPLVWLKERTNTKPRLLPIAIGEFEAASIQMCLEKDEPIRPIAYDLLASMIQESAANILQIVIHTVRQSIFYAKIVVEHNHKIQDIDARPSDAIALALRMDTPVYASRELLETVGVCQLESETDINEILQRFSLLEPQIIGSTQTEKEKNEDPQINLSKEPIDEIEILRKKLASAIVCEEYEEAARLRDEIDSIGENSTS